MKLDKEKFIKDDGRYLIYYTFNEGDSGLHENKPSEQSEEGFDGSNKNGREV